MVRVDDRPAYRLGHRVMTLANACVSSVDVSALAGRHLAVLSERTSQTASLGVLDGTDVVHAVDRPLRYAIALGTRDPARRMAMGRLLLAAHPGEEPTADLRRIAKRGHATESGEHSAGLSAVAVPIPSVTGPSRR